MGINMTVELFYGIKIEGSKQVDEILKHSQDNRYDAQDFFWECSVSEEDKNEVHEYLNTKNIEGTPKLFCFTYYS